MLYGLVATWCVIRLRSALNSEDLTLAFTFEAEFLSSTYADAREAGEPEL